MAQQINLTQIDTVPPSGYSINLGSESTPIETIYTTNLVVNNITGISSTTITITGGTGIEVTGVYPDFTITNTASGETITITGGTGIEVTGTYPDFTITNTASGETITITGGTNIAINGSYPNFGIEFTGTTSTPSGDNREIQFNNNGSFGSSTGFKIGEGNKIVEITATGTATPLHLIGGFGGVEMWVDSAPTKAISYGGAIPGFAADGDIHISTYNLAQSWKDRIIVNNSTGDVTIKSLNGTTGTTRMVESTSGGTLTATKEIITAYIESPNIISGLTDDNNWDNNNDFIGTGITGTYQGQNYYDGTYYYTAVDDDVWIRLNKKRPPYKVYTALLTQNGGNSEDFISIGTLIIGATYMINIVSGDSPGFDFTNVGAPNNNIGTYFVATGTIPNSWGSEEGNVDILAYNPAAPVVTVLENTIGNIWFTYSVPGSYQVKSNNLFTINKTWFSVNSSVYDNFNVNYQPVNIVIGSDSILGINIFGGDDSGNGLLNNTPIEIRVYN